MHRRPMTNHLQNVENEHKTKHDEKAKKKKI